ncbi:hypothetical protein [Paenibacillus bovis]|uniref:DUF11 domain-containing protein n=1 Tax=Paenibacillus bovis TaxID=1616788 RepID=A0A172ZLC0_9BACL|nr:hypothetical protein [Paenibacillus bovis]ANF98339.1 hypothetical protein AR543_21635 [Paenibacillus bovis]
MKNYPTYFLLLAGIVTSSQSIPTSVLAAPVSTSVPHAQIQRVSSLGSLSSVALQSGVSARLSNLQMARKNTGSILVYTLTYTNTTSSPYKLLNAFSKVTTSQGITTRGTVLPEDKTKTIVPAHNQLSVTYYIKPEAAASLNGTRITMFGWDFNSSNYEKKLGSFHIPAAYSPAAAKGHSQKVVIDNLPIVLKPAKLQTIRFNNTSYAVVMLNITNQGAETLDSPNYKTYLQSAGGSTFELRLDHAGREYRIAPGSSKTVTYLTEIPASLKMKKMSLLITRTEQTLQTELPVASFQLPEVTASNLVVPAGKVKTLTIGSSTIETQLKQASMSTSGDKAAWMIQFRVKNTGTQALTLPAYELALKSSEGYAFPIRTKALGSLTLKPLEDKVIQLSAEVPLKLKQSALQLQLVEPSVPAESSSSSDSDTAAKPTAAPATSSIDLPTAFYKIPYTPEQTQSEQAEYTVDNSYGSFGVTLESIQRMPWSTEDMVVAKIRLRNAGSSSVTLPELTGSMRAENNRTSSPVQLVAENNESSSLAAGDSAVYYVIGRFPYDHNLNQLQLELNTAADKSDATADASELFLTLRTGPINSAVSRIASGASFHIQTAGKRAEVKECRTITYTGAGQNIAYTELEMSSEETRTSNPSRLVAYYKTQDNEYYEAEVIQSSKAIRPKGKNLVTVWSQLPANVNTSQLTLYIGEGVKEGQLAQPSDTPTAYINAVELALKKQTPAPVTTLSSNMELFPYTFAVTRATGTLVEGQDTVSFNMTYNLTKNNNYETGDTGHRLILQWIDPSGQIQEKVMVPGTDLTTGQSLAYSTSLTSNAYKTTQSRKFTMNVYDEFQGERIQLGSQSYNLEMVLTTIDSSSNTGSSTPAPSTPDTPETPDTGKSGTVDNSGNAGNTGKNTGSDSNTNHSSTTTGGKA